MADGLHSDAGLRQWVHREQSERGGRLHRGRVATQGLIPRLMRFGPFR